MRICFSRAKKAAAVFLTGVICLGFAAQSAQAGPSALKTYVPGYGDVNIEELGISEEMLEQYSQQAENIDLSDPEAAEAQIKSMAEGAGYSISDNEAGTIRKVLENAQNTGVGVKEMQGMYDAVSGAGEALKSTGDFFEAVKSFFINIFNTIKDWFAGLLHWN